MRGLVVPALGLLAVGTIFSMYDVVWPQYLTARGYDAFIVGVSISVFAIPIILFARLGGRIADRTDRRVVVPVALTLTALCAASYPFLRPLAVILLVGCVEAVAFVFLEPGLYAVIGDSTPEHARGRAMGVGGFFQFGGSAFGAALLGALYGVGEGIPFWGGSAVLLLAGVVCAAGLPPPSRRIRAPELPPVLPMREGEAV